MHVNSRVVHALEPPATGGRGSTGRGHLVSARENFLRASNYWRTAEFYVRGGADGRSLEGWLGNRDCFVAAARLLDHPVEQITIPYEESTLPGTSATGGKG